MNNDMTITVSSIGLAHGGITESIEIDVSEIYDEAELEIVIMNALELDKLEGDDYFIVEDSFLKGYQLEHEYYSIEKLFSIIEAIKNFECIAIDFLEIYSESEDLERIEECLSLLQIVGSLTLKII